MTVGHALGFAYAARTRTRFRGYREKPEHCLDAKREWGKPPLADCIPKPPSNVSKNT
ncbi:MAG: hypothetical protein F6K57_17790 [Moorea sp. SIO4A5]|nr:hypothetical protein [Moorena sp. SIO4A5]